jgi:hypothetical protein
MLIGAGRYTVLDELDAVHHNLTTLAEAFCDNRFWGLDQSCCVVVDDPATTADMLDPIAEAGQDATDTLLLYYAGHGLVGRRGRAAEVLRRLPRPAVLRPAVRHDGTAALPVVIDAWVALQMLRAAATAGEDPALDNIAVAEITLEHLLIGPAISGEVRTPVAVSLDPPARMSAGDCESVYGRRPVVAVLDTGVRTDTSLDVEAEKGGGYVIAPEGFVAVDEHIQMAIRLEGQQAVASGDRSRQVIRHPWDSPVMGGQLADEVDTETGHGMFIADIVRQVASDARVLAVRIMHSDGIAYEGDLICALSLLADRVAAAEEGDLAAMVDVVSLSLGYFSEFFFEGRHDKMRAPRDGPDPDDFSGGLGGWSGPSFAAPQVAAQIVRQLLAGAVADPALRLDRPGEVAAVNRVTQALVSLGRQG